MAGKKKPQGSQSQQTPFGQERGPMPSLKVKRQKKTSRGK